NGAALSHFGAHVVAELEAAQVLPDLDSPAQHDRCNPDVQVIDEVGEQERATRTHAAPDAYVQATCGLLRLGDHVLDRGVAEVEGRAALHLQGRPRRSVGQDVDRAVERWLFAPPTPPVGVVGEAVKTEHGGTE